MRAVFSDALVWRYTITGVSKVIKEGVFKADENGLRLKAMDPSHVILVDLMFPADSFSEYSSEGEEIALNLEEFSKLLRRAKTEDRLALELKGNQLEVSLLGRVKRKFLEPLIELETQEIGEPKIPFKVDARFMADQLREAVRDIEFIGDNFGIKAMDGKLLFFNESELGRAEVVLSTENDTLIALELEEEQQAYYSLDYIKSIVPAAQKAEIARLQFSSEMPCKITFELPQGAWLAVYVAPRTI